MKKLAILALCFFSTMANAKDVEEVVVKARQIKIVIAKITETHKQHPITKNWHYVGEKAKVEKNTKG